MIIIVFGNGRRIEIHGLVTITVVAIALMMAGAGYQGGNALA